MGLSKGWKDRLWILPWLLPLSLVVCQQLPYVQPSLNLGNLPDTSFSCEGKVVGGYYADFETDCQMFHVCTLGQKGETQDIKFLCLQGTVFDQKTRVCERSEEVLCTDGSDIYDVNRELYHNSNKIQLDFAGNVTDSAGDASVAHAFLPFEPGYDASRYPPSDYTDDFSSDCTGYSGCTRTRSEVPLFRRRDRPPNRRRVEQTVPKQRAFSRFIQSRRPNGPSTPAPTTTTSSPVTAEPATVPIIPVASDPDRPRVVVTNGKPFVPKLSSPDPAPALTQEEEFPSLTLPETNFSCEDKVSGGHYADPETDCKMFHICVIGPDDTITDYKFLCGNNTAFEQKSRTCQEIEKIDCASSVLNYYVNNHLIIPTTKPAAVETTTAEQQSASVYDDYYDYYVDYSDYKEFYDTPTTESGVQSSQRSRTGRA